MSRVTWADPGTRFYETGVDRTVLYVNNVGVAWSGVKSISESPTGGAAKPYYMDGIKYLNIAGKEEFEATIEAMGSPTEFAPCDGRQAINNGLFAHQQPRKAFSLSYRTLVGNDTVGQAFGYKIHLVYNALAAPTDRQYSTTGDSSDPTMKSWALTTLPPSLTGMKPTAHFVIDSRSTPKGLLKAIEDILYGSDAADPRMPLVSELIAMFQSEGPITRRNLATNPQFKTNAGTVEVRRNLVINPAYKTMGASYEIRRNYCTNPNFEANNTTGWANYVGSPTLVASTAAAYSGTYGMRVTVDGTSSIPRISQSLSGFAVGEIFTMSVRTRIVAGTGWNAAAAPYFVLRGGLAAGGEWTAATTVVGAPDANGWRYVTITGTIATGATGQLVVNIGWNNVSGNPPNTAQFDVDEVLIEKNSYALPYFDGNKAPADGLTYSWVGTANASASIASGVPTTTLSFKGYQRNSWVVVGGAADGSNSCLSYVGHSSSPTLYANTLLLFNTDAPTLNTGDMASGRFRVRLRNATTPLTIVPRLFGYTAGGSGVSGISQGANVTVPADGSWVDVVIPAGTLPATVVQARLYITSVGVPDLNVQSIIEVSNILIERNETLAGPWFDGNSTNLGLGLTCSWTGTVNNSIAIATGNSPVQGGGGSSGSGRVWQTEDGRGIYIEHHGSSYTVLSGYATGFTADMLTPRRISYSFDVVSNVDMTLASAVAFGSSTGRVFNYQPLVAGVPMRISATADDPLLVTGAVSLMLGFHPNGTTAINGRLRVDNLVITEGDDVGTYFDGSTVDADKYFYSWEGAVDASVSRVNTWN